MIGMKRLIRRLTFGIISLLGISLTVATLLLLNPQWLYANTTQIDFITIYHNENLEPATNKVVRDAASIMRTSQLYHKDIEIDLCINDHKWYPRLNYPARYSMAYAVSDKTILNNCEVNFSQNRARIHWSSEDTREFDLTWLVAHEFTHNLQYNYDTWYIFKSTLGGINWKLEGHAEYIGRKFKGDNRLVQKVTKYLQEAEKVHDGIPAFKINDGTYQNLSYFKYAIIVQYLFEQQGLDYEALCSLDISVDQAFQQMIDWHEHKISLDQKTNLL